MPYLESGEFRELAYLTCGNGPGASRPGTYHIEDPVFTHGEASLVVPPLRTFRLRVSFSGSRRHQTVLVKQGDRRVFDSAEGLSQVFEGVNSLSTPITISIQDKFYQEKCAAMVGPGCVSHASDWVDAHVSATKTKQSLQVGYEGFDWAPPPAQGVGPGTYSESVVSLTWPAPAPGPILPTDRIFAFDFDSSGHLNYLVLYRPGSGGIWFLKRSGLSFVVQPDGEQPYSGIGGYDLTSPDDQAFAFDYDRTGKLDHLVLFRPSSGGFWVLEHKNGRFSRVAIGSLQGIGGYNAPSRNDRAFALDYNGVGRADHIAIYRPGGRMFGVLENRGRHFEKVYGFDGGGVSGFDLSSEEDRVFPYDYESAGRLDHLALYRPGTGIFWIGKRDGIGYRPVFQSSTGIGGYDLTTRTDTAFAFDFDNSGKMDHIAVYRPGWKGFWIIKRTGDSMAPVYRSSENNAGIGGYDFSSTTDQAIPYDFNGNGHLDSIIAYRPGTGGMWNLVRRGDGNFAPLIRYETW